ncbi:DUF1801 domain-containing protein [Sneathiella limimaris]|uniref:DUF1801 domain-containing protein n=1 Tax=Sneathiella limimaris TaxID=1964213 RepID=UPI00146CD753|nr:DUF1801 domain-containing protein [Sneathiella limimaris]
MHISPAIQNPDVRDVFSALPKAAQAHLATLRNVIFDFSSNSQQVGKIEECLKWGQISFVPYAPKSGTTIRFDYDGTADRLGLLVHCQTRLIDDFRHEFPNAFEYEKNRGLWFSCKEKLDLDLLKSFIFRALTYHL